MRGRTIVCICCMDSFSLVCGKRETEVKSKGAKGEGHNASGETDLISGVRW